MIVKNESVNIERCLTSVAPYISCWCILDTGSTDDTKEKIQTFFDSRKIPGELYTGEFTDFSTTRNEALELAKKLPYEYGYLLLLDADMELTITPGKSKESVDINSYFKTNIEYVEAYRVAQTAMGLTYYNTRILRRNSEAKYVGVTHEYLNASYPMMLQGISFIDYADGGSRGNKFERDLDLLTKALEADPTDARSCYYLAQTYRDLGKLEEARDLFFKRSQMPGWDEETWSAHLQRARILKRMGYPNFITAALEAYSYRPKRSEPIYDLAKYCREQGLHEAGAEFAEIGMNIPKPDNDILFIEDYPYDFGLEEEFSICAYYSPNLKRRMRGANICEELAMNEKAPQHTRDLAWSNLRHYKSLKNEG
jgi:glycosyltransferase involved in cell wall biosynthesis